MKRRDYAFESRCGAIVDRKRAQQTLAQHYSAADYPKPKRTLVARLFESCVQALRKRGSYDTAR